jgi:hypothetical protein
VLAVASASAVMGTGIAAGSASAAATPASAPVAPVAPVAPTIVDHLSAPGGTVDAQGNLSVVATPSGVRVAVAYAVAPGTATAGAAGSELTSATLDCGTSLQGTVGLLKTTPSGPVTGTGYCVYGIGTHTIKLTATDDQNPAVTTTTTQTVTISYPADVKVDRFDGATRYGTGVALSQAEFPTAGSAGAVVLARGDVFADALAGIPLAKYKNAPLLLTPGGPKVTALDPNVQAELLRVLPNDKTRTVFLLGGTSAIPQAVQDHISDLGYTVVRLSGDTRYATALAIARDPRALADPAHLVLARGDDFADALAAGPYAANSAAVNGVPAAIVLSDGPAATASLDLATKDYVIGKLAGQQAHPGVAAVTAIGGGAAAVTRLLPGGLSGGWSEIAGQDRYATAEQVAHIGWGGPQSGIASSTDGLASGTSFADALTGGAYMALKNGPLLLTDPAGPISAPASDVLRLSGRMLAGVEVFGGTAVLDGSLVTAVGQAVKPTPVIYTDHHQLF